METRRECTNWEIMRYRRALVFGASGGIGSALVEALDADEVVGLSRSAGDFDLIDEGSIAKAAKRFSEPFDLILDATGALEIDGVGPEKSIQSIDPQNMARQFALNAIGPALIFKHFWRLLPRENRSIMASLSARVGSIGDNNLGGWISYRASKAALNQVVKTTSIELKRTRAQTICVALHPGTIRTPLTEKYVGNHPAVSPEEGAQNILSVLDGLEGKDTGKFLDWAGKTIQW